MPSRREWVLLAAGLLVSATASAVSAYILDQPLWALILIVLATLTLSLSLAVLWKVWRGPRRWRDMSDSDLMQEISGWVFRTGYQVQMVTVPASADALSITDTRVGQTYYVAKIPNMPVLMLSSSRYAADEDSDQFANMPDDRRFEMLYDIPWS